MRSILVAVALALSTTACESSWMKAYGPTFPGPNEGQAALYVVRDAAPEGAAPINLTMSRQAVGRLAGATWMRFDVLPDLYDLRVYGPQGNNELIVTVMPGESRFFLAEPTAQGSAQLREIRQADGRRLVRAGQQAATAYR